MRWNYIGNGLNEIQKRPTEFRKTASEFFFITAFLEGKVVEIEPRPEQPKADGRNPKMTERKKIRKTYKIKQK